MKLIFSVYDSAVKYFTDPFVVTTRGEALSQFMTGANTKDSWLSQRPSDFTLFMMGKFDEECGQFIIDMAPESLGTALEFIRVKPVEVSDNPEGYNPKK